MSKFISVKEFSELYNVSEVNVHVIRFHKNPSWIKVVNKRTIIDVQYLLEHQEWQKKLWLSAHDYYFYFTHVFQVSQNFFSKIIAEFYDESYRSWYDFMQTGLFKTIEKSLIHTNISSQLLKFVEFCELFIPKLNRRFTTSEAFWDNYKDMRD